MASFNFVLISLRLAFSFFFRVCERCQAETTRTLKLFSQAQMALQETHFLYFLLNGVLTQQTRNQKPSGCVWGVRWDRGGKIQKHRDYCGSKKKNKAAFEEQRINFSQDYHVVIFSCTLCLPINSALLMNLL